MCYDLFTFYFKNIPDRTYYVRIVEHRYKNNTFKLTQISFAGYKSI